MTIEHHQHSPIHPPRRTLMGPGPSDVSASVLSALGAPTVGHLDPYFLKIMDEVQDMLRTIFHTTNELTLAVSGTGSSGMEACVVNLLEPGDKIVVCTNGVFGGRMADVAGRIGAEVVQINRPFGEVFSVEEIEEVVKKEQPKVVGIVHAETSTGAAQSLNDISKVVHEADALLLVDCVTSLGGMPVKIDEWDIDAAYSGTQKCLSCPPGLSPVTFSSRAVAAMDARKTKVSSWYLDMSMVRSYWGDSRAYHHTAPINMNYGLHEALRLVLAEGMENRFSRHYANHCALKSGLEAMGIEFAVAEDHQLPMLNAVKIPDGVDDADIRGQLLSRFGIEIGGGLGPMKGKTWRIGLMGESSQTSHVLLFLAALDQCLIHAGYQLSSGAGVAAANDFYRTTITD
ncbi:MAG: alanine--glyoxylate aminotransferase family protein [Planctomycetes bacterium]|nr:alanine--glyoxylate aminotransferase family protein [Planctomycetota bacterium]MCH9725284.1 alanine--glyoxylate aminotransferase family protein [Planctomycetota bacterium]MCH9779496.1 alanine--glyoxylate aminotransferase family protein [Planctomycetota bacterium]MCH9792633.1 alanine--glyoxylate aminotransferase family protein [Planctomycetota bacterium]